MISLQNNVAYVGFQNLIYNGQAIKEVYRNYRPQLLHGAALSVPTDFLNDILQTSDDRIALHFFNTAPEIDNQYPIYPCGEEPIQNLSNLSPVLYYNTYYNSLNETRCYNIYCNMNERFTWCLSSLQSPKIVDILFDTPMYAPRGSSVNFYKTKLEERLPFLDGEVYMLDAYANVDPALTAHFISPQYFCKNLLGTYSMWSSYDTPVCNDKIINLWKTYEGCKNITQAVIGNNVRHAFFTYNSCSNLTHAIKTSNLLNSIGMYQNCTNLIYGYFDNISPCSYSSMYQNTQNLTKFVVGNNTKLPFFDFFMPLTGGMACYNLTQLELGQGIAITEIPYSVAGNVRNIISHNSLQTNIKCAQCVNLRTLVANMPFVTAVNYAYCRCLKKVDTSDNITAMCYTGCETITEAWCGNNVTNLSRTYYGCYNIQTGIF